MPFWSLCYESNAILSKRFRSDYPGWSDHVNIHAEFSAKKFANPVTTAAVLNNVSYWSRPVGTLSQYIISLAKFKRIETEGSIIKEKFKNDVSLLAEEARGNENLDLRLYFWSQRRSAKSSSSN